LLDVGQQIANARNEQRMSVNVLAKKAGASRQQITKLEAGQNASLRLLGKVVLALGLRWDMLASLDPNMPLLSEGGSPDANRAIEESLRYIERARKLLKSAKR
jgi:transcriptional regulator with XRE-family HTH domain